MDTAYRLATATVATMGEEHDRVLAVLGEDIPLASMVAFDCGLLRAQALYRLGRCEAAISEVERLTDSMEQESVLLAFEFAVPRGALADLYAAVLHRRKVAEIAWLEETLRSGQRADPKPSHPEWEVVPTPREAMFELGCVLSSGLSVFAPFALLLLFVGFFRPLLPSQREDLGAACCVFTLVFAILGHLGAKRYVRNRDKARLRARIESLRLELQRLDRGRAG